MRRWTDKQIFRIAWSSAILAVVLCVGITLVALREGTMLQRFERMEWTINKLTHEVGDCRINRAGSQPLD